MTKQDQIAQLDASIEAKKATAAEIWEAADDLRHRAWLTDIEVSELMRRRHRLLNEGKEHADAA